MTVVKQVSEADRTFLGSDQTSTMFRDLRVFESFTAPITGVITLVVDGGVTLEGLCCATDHHDMLAGCDAS